jgi:hypothetical protein
MRLQFLRKKKLDYFYKSTITPISTSVVQVSRLGYIFSEIPHVASEHYSTEFIGHIQMPGTNTKSTAVVLLLQDYNADVALRTGSTVGGLEKNDRSCRLCSMPIA